MERGVKIPEFAKMLNITPQAVHKRIRRGKLKAERREGSWFIPPEEVDRVVNEELTGDERDDYKVEALWKENERLRELVDTLKKQVDYFQTQNERLQTEVERLTILLANEQAQRLRALPRPLNWLSRLLGRREVTIQ